MKISSSLLAQQPTELLRFKNAKLRAQTITTHKSASFYERICECFWTSAEKQQYFRTMADPSIRESQLSARPWMAAGGFQFGLEEIADWKNDNRLSG